MKIKKMVVFLAILILIFNQSIFAFADTPPIVNQLETRKVIEPMWNNTNDVSLDLYFTDDNAECVGKVEGITGTSNISATFKLERKGLLGWTVENSWTKSVKGKSLSFYGSTPVTKGTYRLSVIAKVTVGEVTETVNTSVQSTK
jgi:hypothetical protein